MVFDRLLLNLLPVAWINCPQFLGGLCLFLLELLLRLTQLFLQLLHFLVLGIDLLLQVRDVPLLILAVLRVARGADEELQRDRIVNSVEIALPIKQVNTIESIVAPAFADFKLRRELTNNLCTGRPVVDHFYAVLVLLGLLLGEALEHLEEDAYVIPFSNPVTIRIHLEPPREARLRDQRRIRVNYLIIVLNLITLILSDSREILNHKD